MSTGGSALERKRVCVVGDRLAVVVAGLAEAQGHAVVGADKAETADLLVLEVQSSEDLIERPGDAPVVAVVPRRLRDADKRALEAQGAARICDAESSSLDVIVAINELLFPTLGTQRRYARSFGGIAARFGTVPSIGDKATGTLLAVSRSGAYMRTRSTLPEGARIEMEIGVNGRNMTLLGRVVFVTEDSHESGFGVEFALHDQEVAPRLSSLVDGALRPVERERALALASL